LPDRHYGFVMADVSALVAAYWRHHGLTQGTREERLAAADVFWAVEAVADAIEGEEPLSVLDALIASPEADLCFLGAGPVEDLLSERAEAWAAPIADRCRRSERWRATLACVWLDEAERKNVEPLAAYLTAGR
jgi:hypothetical protein